MIKVFVKIRRLISAFKTSKYLSKAFIEIKLHKEFKTELSNLLEEFVQKELVLDGITFKWTYSCIEDDNKSD